MAGALGESDPRRSVPRTDTLLADPRLKHAAATLGPQAVKLAVRSAQQQVRTGLAAPADAADLALALLATAPVTLRPVVNATGVVLHTNLGRAPLSAAAVEAMSRAAGYVDVEFDLEAGGRAGRGRTVKAALLAAVPAAEDVHIVNNGAAALVLAACALAGGREIVVSRGELVEIGDGFRIPDLLTAAGAVLREVGTTNRTHLRDYAEAIGPATGFILKIHPSNFRIEGFTSSVPVAELSGLGVPVVADIGSGLLGPHPLLPTEPDAGTWLSQGADVVTASCDKLLGGPQAGLILGSGERVAEMRRHPMARALRVGKTTLAALQATVGGHETPVEAALTADREVLRVRADAMSTALTSSGVQAETVASAGAVGGGSAPGVTLPGWAVRVPEQFAEPLRIGEPSIVGRVEHGFCLLDLRCVPAALDEQVCAAVLAAGRRAAGRPGRRPPELTAASCT
ncbi:L-seryl-tRNA selenium transferase [Catenulispora acidiphila DSM 44928]|uniref:L-seryl-tRNA(Sec) selenium transferase n=1 Tax=Catenulispora acidiphila (strain DSM 44928 / JCM 14897 / NBRC 102108 / NRRL B-24433 / ID139908) TaxID=479433 RepID=C7QC99_CATAD|nr:L-seryl-tRNA selenium transferase [Catenulispora acidiphila DSM 44928]